MARPLSDDKRQALVRSAIEAIADDGVGAPTAKVAKLAGVAEGTLFKYFPTKAALLNGAYLALKADLRSAMLTDFPAAGTAEARSRHVWTSYVNWGAARPSHRRAMSQLAVSELITADTRRQAAEGFGAFRDLLSEWPGLCPASCRSDAAGGFASAVLTAIADTTIDFIAKEPRRAREYADAGFKAFWRAAAGT